MKRLVLSLLLLAACREEAATPLPVAMTEQSVGYFCQMDVLEHPGPKAQVHLASHPGRPLFFSQIRDAVTFLKMPEQIDTVTATYVSDMGAAPSWEEPGALNWVAADAAVYVIGSRRTGGMEAPELVPFADPSQAQAFATAFGGQVVAWADIPDSALAGTQAATGTEDADFAARLGALAAPESEK